MVNNVSRTDNVTWIRWVLGVIGIVFLIAGIWGFFDSSPLGFFELTAAHNWVHVLTGLLYTYIGFAPVSWDVVAWVARIGGIVYALLGVLGFFAPNILAPLLTLGVQENWFHLIVGTVIAVLGFMVPTGDRAVERTRRPTV